jgi:hypothetical protein
MQASRYGFDLYACMYSILHSQYSLSESIRYMAIEPRFRVCETVNSVSFIWNDNMREKREANANAT